MQFSDTLKLKEELKEIKNKLYKKSYVESSLDSLIFKNDTAKAYFFVGKKYFWKKINPTEKSKIWLQKSGVKLKAFDNKSFKQKKWKKIKRKIISYFENNGYPFASIELQNKKLEVKENIVNLSSNLKIEVNKFYKIDTFYVRSKNKLSTNYIYRYTGILPNSVYDESKINQISPLIKNLSFLSEIRSPEVQFTKEKAVLHVFLKKAKANRFNGILGIMPDSEKEGKTLITGEIKLLLINSLNKGEVLNLEWQKLEEFSQKLDLSVDFPYVFGSPFGLEASFSLDKQDTSYLNLNSNLGVRYFFRSHDYVKVFAKTKKSSIISKQLSEEKGYESISNILYGIGTEINHLDYRFNPSKGFAFSASIATGKKEGKEKSNLQTEAEGVFSIYFPIYNSFVAKYQNQSAIIHNSGQIFDNELFKIGGLKTLRGFDQESIFASFYSINTLEIRYLFEENSNFFIFYDLAYYFKNNIKEEKISDNPYGMGVGINFETKVGIFSLSYAVGKQFDNPIVLRAAKIHFGFISKF